MKIDINCDIGEGFGHFVNPCSDEIFKYISSANIACGYHAGDPKIMAKTVALAIENKVAIGAHPGLPDLEGFGRREMAITPNEGKYMVQYQVGALMGICKGHGTNISHVKLHGALYSMVSKDEALGNAIAQGIYDLDPNLKVYCLKNSLFSEKCIEIGLNVRNEVFVDRNYLSDGSLVPRRDDGALITDADTAISRAVEIVDKKSCKSIDGIDLDMDGHTLCIHGDGSHALTFAQNLYLALKDKGIEVASC